MNRQEIEYQWEGQRHLLLLQVILPGTSSFTAGEGAFVVSFTCVNAKMAGKVTTRGESTVASAADMLFLRARL